MFNNDQQLVIGVEGSKPIVVCEYDTPLQLAYRFCIEQGLSIKLVKQVSQSIAGIIKAFQIDQEQLRMFEKYYNDVVMFPKQSSYRVNEIVNGCVKQVNDENYYSFQKKQSEDPVVLNVQPNLNIYRSPTNQTCQNYLSLKDKKLEDLGRKLYQSILSPKQDVMQLMHSNTSQTTKNVSWLQKQLQQQCPIKKQHSPLQVRKQGTSQERFNRTQSTHQKSSIFKQSTTFLESTDKKKSNPIFTKIIGQKRTGATASNITTTTINKPTTTTTNTFKQRCKTEYTHNNQNTPKQGTPKQSNPKLRQQCDKLFQLIDGDSDGLISPQNIDLTGISDDALNLIIPVLLEIDVNKLELNCLQFYQLLQCHYEKFDNNQRTRFLSINA